MERLEGLKSESGGAPGGAQLFPAWEHSAGRLSAFLLSLRQPRYGLAGQMWPGPAHGHPRTQTSFSVYVSFRFLQVRRTPNHALEAKRRAHLGWHLDARVRRLPQLGRY
jgi:hypothetical protein